jgi:lysophospholipase L1-like esterase
MKYTLLLATFSLLTFSFVTPPKKRIVFFGDSITQMGVNPGGYIEVLKKQLAAQGKADQYELIGAGIGGNKVYDLYLRVQEDVLDKKPQTVVIYIGINDVWHKTSGTGTDKDKYEKFYRALIQLFQKNNINVILCTPTVIGEKLNNANPQDADLNAYGDVVRKLAAEKNCALVDLRKIFLQHIEQYNNENKESGVLTTDRVHLNDRGNNLVAESILPKL